MNTVPFSRDRARKLRQARTNGLKRADRQTARDVILAKGQGVTIGGRDYKWLHTGTIQFQVLGGRTVSVSDADLQKQMDDGILRGPFVAKGTLVRTGEKA